MAIFFFLVGLEIKRELLFGELASFRRAALPVIAAIGARSLQDALAGNLTMDELDLTITGVRDIGVLNPPTDLSLSQALISVRPPELSATAWVGIRRRCSAPGGSSCS